MLVQFVHTHTVAFAGGCDNEVDVDPTEGVEGGTHAGFVDQAFVHLRVARRRDGRLNAGRIRGNARTAGHTDRERDTARGSRAVRGNGQARR